MTNVTYEPVSRLELVRFHGPRPGSAALQQAILELYGARGLFDLGIYSARRVQGSSSWSLHRVGRAGDVGFRRLELGLELYLRLVNASTPAGVCEVICNRKRWTPELGERPYGGLDAHRTHLHWGQTRRAADSPEPRAALVAWFKAALAGP